jgi:hypothetical protein
VDGVGSTLGSGVGSALGSRLDSAEAEANADGVGDDDSDCGLTSGVGLECGTTATRAAVVGHDAAARPATSTRVVEVQPPDAAWLTVMPVIVTIAAVPTTTAAARWPRTERG